MKVFLVGAVLMSTGVAGAILKPSALPYLAGSLLVVFFTVLILSRGRQNGPPPPDTRAGIGALPVAPVGPRAAAEAKEME